MPDKSEVQQTEQAEDKPREQQRSPMREGSLHEKTEKDLPPEAQPQDK